MLARLQAVLSRNMYSEQGLLALIGPEFEQCVPLVDGGVVLHARIAAVPGAIGHATEDFASIVLRRSASSLVADPSRLPLLAIRVLLHEGVANAHRQVGILEANRRVSFAVEV